LLAVGAGLGRPGAESQGLAAGALVSVRVLAELGGGLYRVSAGAALLTARSDRPLQPGSLFSARVEAKEGRLSLKPLANASLPLPVPPSGAERSAALAASALLREGISPRPDSLARVRRAFARAEAEGGEAWDRAELAARLEAAGIPAEEAPLDAIHAEARGAGGRHPRPGSEEGRGAAGEAEEASGEEASTEAVEPGAGSAAPELGPAALDLEGPFALELPEASLPAFLGSLLRAISFRSGGEGSLLSLFNHRRGPEASWSYAPFAFELDSIAFEGTIRIQSPQLAGGPGRIEAGFTARRAAPAPGEEKTWSFGLDFGPGREAGSLAIGCGDEGSAKASRRLLPELAAELAAIGRGASVSLEAEGPARGAPRAGGLDLEA